MTDKRFKMVIADDDGNFYYLDKVTDEKIRSTMQLEDKLNELHEENEKLKHELLCKQLDKAPTEPINCKCYYKELQE